MSKEHAGAHTGHHFLKGQDRGGDVGAMGDSDLSQNGWISCREEATLTKTDSFCYFHFQLGDLSKRDRSIKMLVAKRLLINALFCIIIGIICLSELVYAQSTFLAILKPWGADSIKYRMYEELYPYNTHPEILTLEYDDSNWEIGNSSFGNTTPECLEAPETQWALPNTGIVIRVWVHVPIETTEITVRAKRTYVALSYINEEGLGSSLTSGPDDCAIYDYSRSTNEHFIPGELNLIVVYARETTDYRYFDFQIEAELDVIASESSSWGAIKSIQDTDRSVPLK
ncbi:MAG: hypothetical protein KOO63_12630 [Bacteroidales bacterium]|nr:hypothetical protein [Candidatus Latescibacterota bacterium]